MAGLGGGLGTSWGPVEDLVRSRCLALVLAVVLPLVACGWK